MSDADSLKIELKKKERTIQILKDEIQKLKRRFSESSYENLNQKIVDLEKSIQEKDKEIAELKNITSSGGNKQQLQTKIIILRSKLRKNGQIIDELKREREELEIKANRLEKQTERVQDISKLKEEIKDLKQLNAKYKSKISDLNQTVEQTQQLQQQVNQLKSRLRSQQSQSPSSEVNEFQQADTELVEKLKGMVEERDQRIQELESAAASSGGGGGTSFLAQNRINRKVKELEAQVKMLKRSEAQMKRRYEEAMRKLSMQDEFADW